MSLVHAAFSWRDGASNTTVNGGKSEVSTTSLKSSWPNTWPPPLAANKGDDRCKKKKEEKEEKE